MAVAAALLYTAPVFVGLMSRVLFREKITVRKGVCMVVAFLGCAMTTGVLENSGPLGAEGVLYGLGAGLGYALYSIFGRFALERGYHPVTISFSTFLIAALGAVCLTSPAEIAARVADAPAHIPLLLAFAVVTTVLPFLAYTVGLARVAPGKASVLASVEPVVAAVIGIAWLREGMTVWTGVGVATVVAAIALLQLPERGKKAAPEI
jgi:drug/metabolite transporter (DMT)-like permease